MHAHAAVALLASLSTLAQAQIAPPVTPKKPVADTYHATKLTDDYRWLEDWNSPDVKAWSDAQNAYARAYLDKIPCVPALRDRVTEMENAVGSRYGGITLTNGTYFASKTVPGKQQPLIVALTTLTGTDGERVVLDPNTLDPTGGTSYDWFHVSPDGKLIAVSLSSGGSESGDARVFDTATSKELTQDRIARVNGGTAGGSLAWAADSSGFFYSRYPREGERPKADMDFYTQVYFHKLGAPIDKDTFQTGKDYPKIGEIELEVSHDGSWALANVQNGDGGEFVQDIRTPAGTWTRLSKWEDRIVEAKFGKDKFGNDNALYLVSRNNALNGKVLRLALNKDKAPSLTDAVEIIPERPDASIETAFVSRDGIYLTDSRLLVLYQVGGPNELRVFDLANGKASAHGVVASLPISTVGDIEVLTGDSILYQNESFIDPPAWFTLAPSKSADSPGTVTPTAFKQEAPPHTPKMAVRREMATSKDGTKVPVNIVALEGFFLALDAANHRGEWHPLTTDNIAELNADAANRKPKDTYASAASDNYELVESHVVELPSLPCPLLLTGYGGYGVNETPRFSRRTILFVEQGAAWALANIRGGGEFGERWHKDGSLTNKQHVFDDFEAAADYLVKQSYTSRDKLAIIGGSNGGLLMGATFTQRPDICKAVVSSVGIYDMLRVELSANGAFNVTEFGTVKDKTQFDALYAYSPYHHVAKGTKYPAILFTTGANDPRVDPMQSRKMTASLQAAQSGISADQGGPSPMFLRTSSNTGHGIGSPLSARIEQTVDTYAFLFDQLGMQYTPVKK